MCVCMLQPAGVDYYENTTFRPTVQRPVGRSCLWNIVTKYYKASVQLDFVDCDEVLEAASGESNNFTETEAVIFNCSNTKFCLGKE